MRFAFYYTRFVNIVEVFAQQVVEHSEQSGMSETEFKRGKTRLIEGLKDALEKEIEAELTKAKHRWAEPSRMPAGSIGAYRAEDDRPETIGEAAARTRGAVLDGYTGEPVEAGLRIVPSNCNALRRRKGIKESLHCGTCQSKHGGHCQYTVEELNLTAGITDRV